MEQGDEVLLPPIKAPTAGSGGGKSDRKKFAISLKTKKKLGGSSKKSTGKEGDGPGSANREDAQAPAALPAKVAKQHEADMDKWSVRGREMRQDDAGAGGGNTNKGSSPEVANAGAEKLSSPSADPDKVEKARDGKPICGLCRRKFASLEKLRQHERVSALHKQNLAKKKAAEEAKKKEAGANPNGMTAPGPPPADYRDRAKERRALFGPDAAHGPKADEEPAVMGPSLDRARTVESTEVVAPQENLGESNIGNKMLQKLGWKKGGALGRKQDSSVSADGSETGSAGMAKDTLRADWERIESIAGGNSRLAQGGVGGGPYGLRH